MFCFSRFIDNDSWLLCCAQHSPRISIAPCLCHRRVQIRFHNMRSCINVSRATMRHMVTRTPAPGVTRREDMRNGVMRAPVIIHLSNVRKTAWNLKLNIASLWLSKATSSILESGGQPWVVAMRAMTLNKAWPLRVIVKTGAAGVW